MKKKYQIKLVTWEGQSTPIDTVEAGRYYNGTKYYDDCMKKADRDWCKMLQEHLYNGYIDAEEIEE